MNNSTRDLTQGATNTAVAHASLLGLTGGYANTAVGDRALEALTSGDGNFAVGRNAGSVLTSGNSNIYVGHAGVATESNTIRIGTPSTHTRTFLTGTVTAPAFAGDGSALTGVVAVYQ